MTNKKNIVIVDDHTLFRKGMCMLIDLFDSYQILFDAENGKDFIAKLDNDNLPDIVLLDINMPIMDGYETAHWIKKNYPQIKILALSTMDAETIVIKMINRGANGYILKDAAPEEIELAFNEVLTRGFFYNDLVSRKILNTINAITEQNNIVSKYLNLTDREFTFLRLACTDKSYQEIANEMFVSIRTVDGYRDILFKKLVVTSRIGLVIYAVKNGLVVL